VTITISADDPRTIKALEIAAGAGQWIKCRTRDGDKAYGVPSQCQPGRYYLTDSQSCTCVDFKRYGLSPARVGQGGNHHACKHVLAVRLYCELVKAQATSKSSKSRRRGHLSIVRA
jgi:hypothetical protein